MTKNYWFIDLFNDSGVSLLIGFIFLLLSQADQNKTANILTDTLNHIIWMVLK